ncbi:GNAT family N-acetyltransferase [Paenibacillus sp. IHBB 10380]|uniref:GNAT family N-acetyltransferase n=1 Tax=Paenibacillus sp. IHBB 10380 TaxID=1566358 RepID=UPI000699001A|nr:GNAT family N-acetyltransferase [Paenibacillus sp. IHBB 10380]
MTTTNTNKITFIKADMSHLEIVIEWFNSPHVQEFWGTGDYTRNNFTNNIVNGTKELFDYWVASYDNEPFSLIMTSDASEDTPEHLVPFLEPDGLTLTLDFLIGNKKYLEKGLSYPTINEFQNFLNDQISALLIDPESNNSKAIHVYEKAGFNKVSTFIPDEGDFSGKSHDLMKWKRSWNGDVS